MPTLQRGPEWRIVCSSFSSTSVQAIVAIGSSEERQMSIGDLAKATGVKIVTIRYYEQVGVLPAVNRTTGNYRNYGGDHVRRLRFVRRCRDLGFSLDQVRDLLRLSAANGPSCAEVCAMAASQRAAVEEKI